MTERERLEIAWSVSLSEVRDRAHGEWYGDDGLEYLRVALENAAKLTAMVQDWNWHDGTAQADFHAWVNEPAESWGAADGEVRFRLATEPSEWPELAAAEKAWLKQ